MIGPLRAAFPEIREDATPFTGTRVHLEIDLLVHHRVHTLDAKVIIFEAFRAGDQRIAISRIARLHSKSRRYCLITSVGTALSGSQNSHIVRRDPRTTKVRR